MTEQQIKPNVRVPMIDEPEATGQTAEIYRRIREALGLPFVPDVFRLTSTRSELLEAFFDGYNVVFGGGVLPRETKELISAWTSKVNSCPYCVGSHNYFLLLFGGTEELAETIKVATSPDQLPVDDRTKSLLRLVTKVSEAAYKITDTDWNQVADAGWTNAELLEAVFCAAMFNFINRLVDSLGLGTLVAESRNSHPR